MTRTTDRRDPLDSCRDDDSTVGAPISRRQFLKLAGLAGMAVTVGGGVGGVLGACGEASTTTTTTTQTTTVNSATNTSASAVGAFDARVDALYKELSNIAGFEVNEAIKTGPKGVTGKKVLYVPIILAGSDTFQEADQEHKKACDLLGWSYSSIDPQGDPNKIANALDQARTMKVDGVITHIVDPATVKAPLKALKDAGVHVGTLASPDPEHLHDFDEDPSNFNVTSGWRAAAAAYYFVRQGKMPFKIMLTSSPGQPFADDRVKGFRQFLDEAKAAGIESEVLYTVEGTPAEQTTILPGKMVSAVRAHPDYSVLFGFADSQLTAARSGLAPVGLYDKSKVWVAVDCSPPTVVDMKDGGAVKACLGTPIVWVAWSDIDDLNRMFNGVKPLGGDGRGQPQSLIVPDNVSQIPSEGAWDTFAAGSMMQTYKEIWGLA